jgi:hypothetical protein
MRDLRPDELNQISGGDGKKNTNKNTNKRTSNKRTSVKRTSKRYG